MLIDSFADYFSAVVGRSPRTCLEYAKEARFFAAWLSDDLSEDDALLVANRQDVTDYLIACDQQGNSNATRARKISALRSVYDYLVSVRKVSVNPLSGMPRPRYHRSLPVFLSLDDSKRLIQSARSQKDLFYRRRNTLILVLFINCGLRLAELSAIQMSDVYDDAVRIIGKGNKERFAYLNASCQRALRLWVSKRGNNPGSLFISKQGRAIQPSSIAAVVKSELKAIGLNHVSTHKLRHTAATLLYRQGRVDIRLLQAILGHASIATTEIYTHVVDEQIIAAMESHPLSDF